MNSAVVAPTMVTTASAVSESSNSGLIRATMKMPAVTIVAAWISAEIGVGPSIESGQPDVQRHLRALPHRPDEEANGDHRQQRPRRGSPQADRRRGELRSLREHRRVVERAEVREHETDPEHEAEVADAIGEERLEIRVDRRRPRVPEADQQVGNEPHRLPPEEQLHEIVAHHQHQHAEGEQRDVAEEPGVAGVVRHVADRVDVDHQRHEGDHQHHRRGQRVDQEADGELERPGREPRVDVAVEGVARLHVAVDEVRGDRRHRHAGDAQHVRGAAAEPARRRGRRRSPLRAAPKARGGRVAAWSWWRSARA